MNKIFTVLDSITLECECIVGVKFWRSAWYSSWTNEQLEISTYIDNAKNIIVKFCDNQMGIKSVVF